MSSELNTLRSGMDTITDARERIDHINQFSWNSRDNMDVVHECISASEEALKESTAISYDKGRIAALINISYFYRTVARYDEALDACNTAIALCEQTQDVYHRGLAIIMAAYCYMGRGQYGKAYELMLEALKHAQDQPDSEGKGWVLYSHGIFHFETKNYDQSIHFYSQSLSVFNTVDHKYGIGRATSGIGSALLAAGKVEEAHEHILESLNVFSQMDNKYGMSRSLNDMGTIMRKMGDYNKAEEYLRESYHLRKEMQHREGITTTLAELGSLYLEAGKLDEALEYLQMALANAEDTKNKPKTFQVHHLLGETYKKMKEPWKALEHFQKFYEIKNEVTGDQATNRINQLQTAFATEHAEKEAEIHRLRNVELKSAFDEIALQKKIIEDKNRDITDSILYAKRIQEAIIPQEDELQGIFPSSFVLYKPKDIVSGDFYWIRQLSNDQLLLATADCTGHGVPGAFMSLLGTSFLNEITALHHITQPDLVMNRLRTEIINALNSHANEERKDGMDMVLCHFDLNRMQLRFAAANNPLWIIRNGVLQDHRPDKFPVGKYQDETPFTLHSIGLEKGDVIYTFTDGYADQFGGDKNKKFTYKRLKDLLQSIHTEPMQVQKQKLKSAIEEWQGPFEQIDDICVIGIRIE